jgi:hypothetical protein
MAQDPLDNNGCLPIFFGSNVFNRLVVFSHINHFSFLQAISVAIG